MELKRYILPLLKWWWLILLSSGMAAGASYYAVSQQPGLYQSRAVLMIGRTFENPTPTNAEFSLGEQLAQRYADFARREPVRNATMEALQLQWLPQYNAIALPKTQFVEILVIDTDPYRSQMVANELANQIINLSPTGLQEEDKQRIDFVNEQLNRMQSQIEETENEIEVKQQELGLLFSAQQINEVEDEINALHNKINTIRASYTALLSSSQQNSINALTIIESASRPGTPIDPGQVMTIATATAVGLVLAVGAAYLLEYLDDRVKSPEDVKRLMNLPTLAILSHARMSENQRPFVTYHNPRANISEAFRTLRTNILLTNINKPKKIILITSSRLTEGKSLVATNLATVLAQANNKVLIIDTDLRRPKQHKNLKLNREPGLADLLLTLKQNTNSTTNHNGHTNHPTDSPQKRLWPLPIYLQSAIQSTMQPMLSALSSGAYVGNSYELLGSVQMRQLLAQLSQSYDYIILDSIPVLAGTEAIVLSTIADSVILVIDTKKTRAQEVQEVLDQLQRVNAPIDGVVLNKKPVNQAGYKYYDYYNAVENEGQKYDVSSFSRLRSRLFHRAKHENVINS